eukprot:TRINITY_DN3504_c0_g1_i1.p1 TRINITY_DN3504_c0_g1~~TRINITY_DN3504_c0_g1_i1.p1  ORF type:complete len:542 (-),score=100.16 TRINITY_DN3504_c0_g1_i1:120-1745(-)
MTDYSPLPLGDDDEEELQEFSLSKLEEGNVRGDHESSTVSSSPANERRGRGKRGTSTSPPASPSISLRSSSEEIQEDELELDPEEEILLRWKIEKWRWWPSKMLQQYAFYPWKHAFRIFMGHGCLTSFLPMILFIVLLSYAVTIHHEISSTVETDCIVLSEERESFKKSLIFGRQWRDSLIVTYNTTSEFNLTTTVYVCYSSEQVDECSNKFQVGARFGCMYDPKNETNVLDDVSSHQIDRAFTSTAIISPLILLVIVAVIGLPFYNKRGRRYDSSASFLMDETFEPNTENVEAQSSDYYMYIEGLDQVTPELYRNYLMATAQRHNKLLRQLVVEMEIESAVDPHPIASRAVDDADEYVDRLFEGEKVVEVQVNEKTKWKTRFFTYCGIIIASTVFGITMWLLAFGSHELPEKTVGDSLKFVRSIVIWYGIGCLGFMIAWLYVMLLLMRWNVSGWASGIKVITNRREVNLKGGRGFCLFGVFAEVSPLPEDLKRLQARVRVGHRIHSWLKPSGSSADLLKQSSSNSLSNTTSTTTSNTDQE